MKLYKISQDINNNYDSYDSVVVCAENEEEAKNIHPSEFVTHYRGDKWYGTYAGSTEEYETDNGVYASWVSREDLDKVKVEYLGEAADGIKKGVIVSSFNAG